MSHPSNPTKAQTLRVGANLLDHAAVLGANVEPTISAPLPGFLEVNFTDVGEKISHQTISAWQLALGQAWDMKSLTHEYAGKTYRLRHCYLTYQDVTVHLSVSQETAVAA